MSYLRYLCLFPHSGVQYILIIRVTLRVTYKRQELFALRGRLDSPPVFGGVHIAHLLYVVFFYLVCLRPVSCVSGVASVSGVSILDCPFCFL